MCAPLPLLLLQVQVGDTLRAVTCVLMQMTYPTMNLMFGGASQGQAGAGVSCSAFCSWSIIMDACKHACPT